MLQSLSFAHSPRCFILFVFIFTWFISANAHSTSRRPLKRLDHPSVHSIEILPRFQALQPRGHSLTSSLLAPDSPILRNTDSLRLTLSVFGQTFYLHLRPNLDLLHPSARVNYYKNGPDGKAVLDYTEPLLPSRVMAYHGDVLLAEDSHQRIWEDIVGGFVNSNKVPLGWARIIIHHQGDIESGISPVFTGAFSIKGTIHHVMTLDGYNRLKHPLDPPPLSHDESLVIFRDSDLMTEHEEMLFRRSPSLVESSDLPPQTHPSTCAHDRLAWNTDATLNPALRKQTLPSWRDSFEAFVFGGEWNSNGDNSSFFEKRDDTVGSTTTTNFIDHIGQIAGCPIDQKIVYMGVAADCMYVKNYGSTANATKAILSDWNMASGLYKQTFNVSLAIVHLDIQAPTCPSPQDSTRPWNVDCSSVQLDNRLNLFSVWRSQKGDDGAGLWHLMSGCPSGTEVGVAWTGTICQTDLSGAPGQSVSGTAVTTAGPVEWQVVAHEIGHNFGAICVSGCNSSSPCCPLSRDQCDSNSQFILSPTASGNEMQFSQCTLGNICSLMQSGRNQSCIQSPDPTKQTFALQMCGNGIVEAGEDCDPGLGSNSTCCNPATCKFVAGAVCDPASSSCCTSSCLFAPSTQVCRPSQDSTCDIAELCTGTSANCPWDRTRPDGLSCGSGDLACASGKCTSPSQQCQTVGASMGLSKACPSKGDTSCRITCEDPQSSGRCLQLKAALIDGSPCGYGGKCSGGKCQSGSLLDTIKAWYLQNLQISVPVTVVAGVILIFMIYGLIRCFVRCCCGGRKDISSEPGLRTAPRQRISSWVGPPIVGGQSTERLWVPPPGRNGNNMTTGDSIRINSTSPRPSGEIPSVLRPGASVPRARGGSNQGNSSSTWVDATSWNGR